MKKHIFLPMLLVFSLPLFSQINYWAWDGTGTGYGKEGFVNSPCVADAMGNVYVTGVFSSPAMQFGNITLQATDTGYNNIFIVKYNGAGDVVWARSAGGDGDANCFGMAVDAAGDLYLGGWFFGDSLVFDNTILRQKRLQVIIQATDNFLAKYDANGNLLWAKTQDTVSSGLMYVNGIACDAAGNLFVGGAVDAQAGPVIFEGDTLATFSVGPYDVFVAKFDPNGYPLLTKNATGTTNASDRVFGITIDASGNLYITGTFYGTLSLDSVTLSGTTGNYFAARINSNWNTEWAVTSATPVGGDGWAIATDNNSSVYVTGVYNADSFAIGSTTLHGTSALGYGNLFIAKYDTGGNFKWLDNAGSEGQYDASSSLAFDSLGEILIGGTSNDSLFITGADTFKNTGAADIFLEAFNPTGSLQWAETYGTSGTALAGICSSPHGNVYMAGEFNSDMLVVNNFIFRDADTPNYHSFLVSHGFLPFTDIAPLYSSGQFSIFPNPCGGSFEVIVPDDAFQVNVLNSLGQNIQSRLVSGSAPLYFTLNAPGLYFVQVNTGMDSYTQKLVVAR